MDKYLEILRFSFVRLIIVYHMYWGSCASKHLFKNYIQLSFKYTLFKIISRKQFPHPLIRREAMLFSRILTWISFVLLYATICFFQSAQDILQLLREKPCVDGSFHYFAGRYDCHRLFPNLFFVASEVGSLSAWTRSDGLVT